MSLCYIALYCHVHYDIYWHGMIFSLTCINSQPIFNVIDVYYKTQMMILIVNCIYHKGFELLFLYSFLLSTELKRGEESFVIPCIVMNSMWLCSMIWWYVNKCCLNISISGSSVSVIKPPWHFWYALSPTLANLAQWSGWNHPQYNLGNY